MSYHSITLSTITLLIAMSSSSGLEIPMADLWAAIQCASVDILELLHTTKTMSGSAKMEAMQELYLITVSIPNIFIDTRLKN